MDYRWTETPEIRQKLTEIEALKIVVKNYPPNLEILENIRRHNLLKSAVYSARVENIEAHIDDPQVHRKLEIQNLLSAYRLTTTSAKLNLEYIKKLHQKMLNHLSPSAGNFRTEPWAIYNQAGVAVYIAPLHIKIPELMSEYISYINSLNVPIPVISAIGQFIFEKIHPFADGNGRVGRLISTNILNSHNYDFSGLSVFEEYTDKHRELYYSALEPNKDMTEFIEYFLDSLINSVKNSLEDIKNKPITKFTNQLLPRRQEILNIIADHPLCSFDSLKRRFASVPVSSLHYDLQYLQKKNLIVKHGTSRGAVYSTKSE